VIGVLGVLDDSSKVVKLAFRTAGDAIVLLDGLRANEQERPAAPREEAREFSSSEYSKTIAGIVAGEPPAIDLTAEKRLIDCLIALATEGLVQSAHDISDGGLAVTLAEACFPPNSSSSSALGADVRIEGEFPSEFAVFGERGARAVVSAKPDKLAALLATARQYGVATAEIGSVTPDNVLRIQWKGRAAIDSPVDALRDAWAHSLERTLKIQ
jgi:phosphoribosylformylglycinamidine (FGAM) synthase-like enzyme